MGTGRIIELSAEGVAPATLKLTTKKLGDRNVGESLTFEKGEAGMSG